MSICQKMMSVDQKIMSTSQIDNSKGHQHVKKQNITLLVLMIFFSDKST